METSVLNAQGKETGKCELPESLFGLKADRHLLHEAVTAYLANQRKGCACTKTRSEVSGGGKKPWKQKGTGRARQGSTRSPIWRHGGVTFGPKPRSYRQELPIAKRRLALAHALSAKQAGGHVIVLDKLSISQPKTAELYDILAALNAGRKPVLVSSPDANVSRAAKNVPGLICCRPADLNAYTVLSGSRIIITKDSLGSLKPAAK
ncbi:MAG TPA: 50S ribosomal protein L4 [Elusimicrobiales bacterium]|nr:50S ribosomal protein L4 [Elusimicrobiales bacterium]